MKLYVADRAPNPRRVLWVVAEKAIEGLEVIALDIFKGEHKTHPIIAATGGATIPVLELDDGTLIAESMAIARYFESLVPEPNLFGRDAKEIALIEMWTRRVEFTLSNPLMLAARMSHPALSVLETPKPEVADYYLSQAREALAKFDEKLADQKFIVADRLTMADIIAVCSLDFARIIRFRPDKDLLNIARWLEEIRARPAAKAA